MCSKLVVKEGHAVDRSAEARLAGGGKLAVASEVAVGSLGDGRDEEGFEGRPAQESGLRCAAVLDAGAPSPHVDKDPIDLTDTPPASPDVVAATATAAARLGGSRLSRVAKDTGGGGGAQPKPLLRISSGGRGVSVGYRSRPFDRVRIGAPAADKRIGGRMGRPGEAKESLISSEQACSIPGVEGACVYAYQQAKRDIASVGGDAIASPLCRQRHQSNTAR